MLFQIFVWLCISLVLGVALLYWRYRPRTIPGVPTHDGWHPVLGSFPAFSKNLAGMDEFFLQTALKTKIPFVTSIPGWFPWVNIFDPANLKHVLKTNFANYGKGPVMEDILAEFLGSGILATDGDTWRLQRKVVAQMFSQRVLREHMEGVLTRHGQRVLEVLDKAAAANVTVDMQDIFVRYTLDSIGSIAFGTELDNLSMEDRPFSQAFDFVSAHVCSRMTNPIWKIQRFLGSASETKFKECVKIVDDYLGGVVRNRMDELMTRVPGTPRDRGDGAGAKNDLVSLFIDYFVDNGISADSKFLRDMGVNLLLAGRDTTSSMLTSTLMLVDTHEDVKLRLVEEVKDVLRGKMPTAEELRRMPYMDAVLSEALRLYPPFPQNAKYAFHDDVLPDGTRVPAGFAIGVSPYVIGRLPSIWGEDAQEFKPQRWIDKAMRIQEESDSRLIKSRSLGHANWTPADSTLGGSDLSIINAFTAYEFPVFNAGPRMCPGRQTAYLEAKMILSMLLQRFDLKLSNTFSREGRPGLLTAFKHGLPMTVQRIPASD